MDKITIGVLIVTGKNEVSGSTSNIIRLIDNGVIKNGNVVRVSKVTDSKVQIEKVLADWTEDGIHVIFTRRGREVSETEATAETTALAEIIAGIQPCNCLRGITGRRGNTLVIELPGGEKASEECVRAAAHLIPVTVNLWRMEKEANNLTCLSVRKEKASVVVTHTIGEECVGGLLESVGLSKAQEIVLERIYNLRKAKVAELEEGLGHVLAEDVIATDNTSLRVSKTDGYAVISSDKTTTKSVVSYGAGSSVDIKILPGQCCAITTGIPLPLGADAVLQKNSVFDPINGCVEIKKQPLKGEFTSSVGDFKMGQMLLKAGTRLSSSAVGFLAAARVTEVRVFQRPRVAVFSTGDYLQSSHLRDRNRTALLSTLKEENFQAVNLGNVPDNPGAIRNSLEKGFELADVVVTTGTTFMGERHYLKDVLLSDFGAEIPFDKIKNVLFNKERSAMQASFAIVMFEGKPKLWFDLPGTPNPVFVTSRMLLLPVLKAISGFQKVLPTTVMAEVSRCVYDNAPTFRTAALTYDERNHSWTAEELFDEYDISVNGLLHIPDSDRIKIFGDKNYFTAFLFNTNENV